MNTLTFRCPICHEVSSTYVSDRELARYQAGQFKNLMCDCCELIWLDGGSWLPYERDNCEDSPWDM